MELVFNRPNTAQERIDDPDVVRRLGGANNETGSFNAHGFWECNAEETVITITFSPTIYLSNTLDAAMLEEVRTHEQGHLNDYLDLTAALQADIQQAIRARVEITWEEIQIRRDWFNYDMCLAAERYHRSVGQEARTCSVPYSTNPEWSTRETPP
jgi:hypothetical protein